MVDLGHQHLVRRDPAGAPKACFLRQEKQSWDGERRVTTEVLEAQSVFVSVDDGEQDAPPVVETRLVEIPPGMGPAAHLGGAGLLKAFIVAAVRLALHAPCAVPQEGQRSAAVVGIRAKTKPLVPGRICLLGTIASAGGPLGVLFACRMRWVDAAAVLERAERLKHAVGSVILVAKDLPPASL